MMNGANSYPGQPWLWWASLWYQIPTFNPAEDATTTTSLQDNADAWIFYIIGVIGLVIIFFPFIPGLRSIPRWIPVHRLIWRTYYRRPRQRPPGLTPSCGRRRPLSRAAIHRSRCQSP